MTAAAFTDSVSRPTETSASRGTGLIAIATGIAAVVLLLNHPGGQPGSFADMVKDEATNQVMNAVVHGGFIAVLALQIFCYARLSAQLGTARALPLAGLVFFATGAAFMMASLLLDGLVLPAIAAKYMRALAAKEDFAKVAFIVVGTTVQFLMPVGILFQSAGITAWGMGLSQASRRVLGLLGLLVGAACFAAAAASLVTGQPMLLMAAIVGLALWAFVAGAVLLSRKV